MVSFGAKVDNCHWVDYPSALGFVGKVSVNPRVIAFDAKARIVRG
jgi:hypothetical protein